ncbi:MAG TPA: ATP-binding protein [Syntrophorhabdaceae bacterium]|nr:ATP-binding protein [Syntrophorhabdaceae bacterium]
MEGENGTSDNKQQQGRYQVLGEYTGEAKTASIDTFIEFAASHARDRQFTGDRIDEIDRVLREVLTNIINFTFDRGPGEIKVSCNLDKFGKFVLAIVDSGKPFNMLLEDDPFIGAMEAANDKPRPTTRTMKRLSSNIEYKRLENKNHLIITLARDMKSGKA